MESGTPSFIGIRRKVFHSHGGILCKVFAFCQVIVSLNGNKLLHQKKTGMSDKALVYSPGEW